MEAKKDSGTGGLLNDKPGEKTAPEDQEKIHEGLKILARMIARAYLRDIEWEHLAEIGLRPKMYIQKIQITMDCININDTNVRQTLHNMIDEAIESANAEGFSENSLPLTLKRDGISIRLKC
jgi:hypothetical protein